MYQSVKVSKLKTRQYETASEARLLPIPNPTQKVF